MHQMLISPGVIRERLWPAAAKYQQFLFINNLTKNVKAKQKIIVLNIL